MLGETSFNVPGGGGGGDAPVSQLLGLSTGEAVRTSEPPVSQLLGLSTGESERTRSGDLESTAILWIDLDDG